MQTLDIFFEPLRTFLQQVGFFVPRLAVAAVIVFVGWLLAKAFRFAVVKALRAINFHVLTERAGVDNFLQQGGTEKDTTDLFGLIGYWLVIVGALIVASNGLGLDRVTELLTRVVLFLPRLLVAMLLLIFGAYFAQFVGHAVARYFRNLAVGDADLLGRIVQWALLLFVILLAVDHLDIGGGLIQHTFLILLTGVVLAVALAFGIGGRERAARLLDRWFPGRDADRRAADREPPAGGSR